MSLVGEPRTSPFRLLCQLSPAADIDRRRKRALGRGHLTPTIGQLQAAGYVPLRAIAAGLEERGIGDDSHHRGARN
jgi:hypothetical protein